MHRSHDTIFRIARAPCSTCGHFILTTYSFQFLWAVHIMFSTQLELQIAIGFGFAYHGNARWTQLLRWMVLISFIYCVLWQLVNYFLVGLAQVGFANNMHIGSCVVATILSYLWAFWGARRVPLFARQRAIHCGASYAVSSLLVLAWLAYYIFCVRKTFYQGGQC